LDPSSLLEIYFYQLPKEIFDLMFSDWVSFLAYPNLFGIKGFVVVVVVVVVSITKRLLILGQTCN
jgi:hypothetical protein